MTKTKNGLLKNSLRSRYTTFPNLAGPGKGDARTRHGVVIGASALVLACSSLIADASAQLPPSIPQTPVANASSPQSTLTDQQVHRGQALLATIIDIARTIPLADTDRVIRSFGSPSVEYEVRSTHVMVTAKNTPALEQIGIASLVAWPWRRGKIHPLLNGHLLGTACIQRADVGAQLGQVEKSRPVVIIDRPPQHDFHPTAFEYRTQGANGLDVKVTFAFVGKECADDFALTYWNPDRSEP